MPPLQQRAYDYFTQAANAGNTHAMAFLGKVGEICVSISLWEGDGLIYEFVMKA